MDHKLAKLIDSFLPKFDDWVDKLNAYNSIYSSDKIYTNDEKVNLLYEASGVLGELSDLFFKYGAFKDNFNSKMMYINHDGPCVIIKSEKTDNVFYLAMGNRGIYLETYFRHAENIRYMDDRFYLDILSLEKLGNFELIQQEYYGRQTTDKYPGIFNNNKSKLFKVFRNYFVGIAEQNKEIYLDHFRINWTADTDFYELVANSCIAFRTLYKLSYDLWRISDLQVKKNKSMGTNLTKFYDDI